MTANRQPSRILIVESDIIIRSEISAYLRGCGYRIREASSPGEAMVMLQQSGHGIDTILIEVDPAGEFAEFALAQWVRKHQPRIEVILASSPERSLREAADLCSSGPAEHKPRSAGPVLDRIKKLLAARARNMSELTDPDA